MNKSIKVGVYDWVKFPIKNNYYPDDLPEEWKLSYFSNDFETACINLSSLSLDLDLLTEWVEDLPDGFKLSFVLTQLSQLGFVTELVSQVALKIDYLIVDSQERDILLQNNSNKTVLLAPEIAALEQIISASSIWTPENNVESSGIALLPQIDNMRQYRRWIEIWLLENDQQDLTLWLDGATAQYSTISELRTLVELMGY